MSDKESLDIGKVVGLIMENPALIEQISNLAKGGREVSENTPEDVIAEVKGDASPQAPKAEAAANPITELHDSKSNRQRLLGALKPYVSEERAKAIDSMLTIAEILDMMKAR